MVSVFEHIHKHVFCTPSVSPCISWDLAQYCVWAWPYGSLDPFIAEPQSFLWMTFFWTFLLLSPPTAAPLGIIHQTSLIFSRRAADGGFSRSENHLSDPCADGWGSGVEDRIDDWRWGGSEGVSQADNDIPETQRWTLETRLSLSGRTGKGLHTVWEVW